MFERSAIRESMEIRSSDSQHVGRVDHLVEDEIELARWDANTRGRHYLIPLAWVDHVDDEVHLNVTKQEAVFWWRLKTDEDHSRH